jgi:alanine dehydrogenase
LIGRDHIHAELGEIVLRRKPARTDDREITFFKSVGIAIQDAAASRVAMQNARRLGLGARVAW